MVPSICSHLKPYLNELSNAGYKVSYTAIDEWENAKKVLYLDPPTSSNKLDKSIDIKNVTSPLEYYEDEGSPHDKPEKGIFCNKCKEALVLPHRKKMVRNN